jgi:hypothetical protein
LASYELSLAGAVLQQASTVSGSLVAANAGNPIGSPTKSIQNPIQSLDLAASAVASAQQYAQSAAAEAINAANANTIANNAGMTSNSASYYYEVASNAAGRASVAAKAAVIQADRAAALAPGSTEAILAQQVAEDALQSAALAQAYSLAASAATEADLAAEAAANSIGADATANRSIAIGDFVAAAAARNASAIAVAISQEAANSAAAAASLANSLAPGSPAAASATASAYAALISFQKAQQTSADTVATVNLATNAISQPFQIIAANSGALGKRQVASGFVGPNGLLGGAEAGIWYTLQGTILFADGLQVSTNPGVQSMPFTGSNIIGSITTSFARVGGGISWANESFYEGAASFCVSSNGTVYAVFHPPTPSDCSPAVLVVSTGQSTLSVSHMRSKLMSVIKPPQILPRHRLPLTQVRQVLQALP